MGRLTVLGRSHHDLRVRLGVVELRVGRRGAVIRPQVNHQSVGLVGQRGNRRYAANSPQLTQQPAPAHTHIAASEWKGGAVSPSIETSPTTRPRSPASSD